MLLENCHTCDVKNEESSATCQLYLSSGLRLLCHGSNSTFFYIIYTMSSGRFNDVDSGQAAVTFRWLIDFRSDTISLKNKEQ